MDKSIFRAYDIRGIYPTELSTEDAYGISRAVFGYAKPRQVAVGRDARLSAPVIHQAICQGFLDSGCKVTDLGIISSDMSVFAAGTLDFDLTVMVTASHNPKEWIGIKLINRGGAPIGGAGEIEEIANIVGNLNEEWRMANEELADIEKVDLLPGWIKHLLSFIDRGKIKPMKIVVDAGNGVAGPIVQELFKHLPIELVEMYFEPDGNFPNHLPSPIEPKNTKALQKKVVEVGADLGMAFDGDADRVFLVDERGERITGSEMTAVIMDKVLSEDSSRVVLYNAICGLNVSDVIKRHHAKSFRTKVGHGYIKKDMKKYGAYFAGEHSGHYFFQDNFNADSGLVAAMLVLALLSDQDKSLSEILKPHRQYVTIPETNFKVSSINVAIEELARKYNDGAIDYLDGLTVRFGDWWFNVRPSATEPLLRLNIEAISQRLLEAKKQELISIVTQLAQVSA